MSTPIRVRFAGKWCAYISGPGSRELVSSLRNGKAPVWSVSAKAWAVKPATAADVIAIAESRGRRVLVSDDERPTLAPWAGDAS